MAPPFLYFREVSLVKNTNVGVMADGYYYAELHPPSAFLRIRFQFIILPLHTKKQKPYRGGVFSTPIPRFSDGGCFNCSSRIAIKTKRELLLVKGYPEGAKHIPHIPLDGIVSLAFELKWGGVV